MHSFISSILLSVPREIPVIDLYYLCKFTDIFISLFLCRLLLLSTLSFSKTRTLLKLYSCDAIQIIVDSTNVYILIYIFLFSLFEILKISFYFFFDDVKVIQ